MTDPTKVLIVDDSRIFRSALEEALAGDEAIKVVSSVFSGAKALDFIRATPPDLVTLDVEMPGMGGIEVLRAIQQFNDSRPGAPPVGVIMVSAYTREGADVTIQALEAGALDFVTKPTNSSAEENVETLRQQLVGKIRQFRIARKRTDKSTLSKPPRSDRKTWTPIPRPSPSRSPKVVVMAVSTGGPAALKTLLPDLCKRVDLPIFIVQHMPAPFTQSLAESLNLKCSHAVIEARDGEVVQPRTVYIAPAGKHLLLRRGKGEEVLTVLNEQPPEKSFRPSADVLFRSAAAVHGGDVVAVVLTGMMDDGTQGLGPLKRAGAHVIAQDEATSVVWGMPGSAVAAGMVDQVLPLQDIAAAIESVTRRSI